MNLKEHVLANIELLNKYLTKAKMEFKQRENSAEIVNTIDSYLIALKTYYGNVEQADTKEELVKELREYKNWIKEKKSIVLGFQHNLRLNRIDKFVIRAKILQYKFSTVIDRLIEEGNSPMDAKQLVEQFSTHIDSAKSNYEKAKSIMELEGEATQESIDLMDKAKNDLKEAKNLLRGIISKLNFHGVSISELKQIKSLPSGAVPLKVAS
jgi:hypothetical protein